MPRESCKNKNFRLIGDRSVDIWISRQTTCVFDRLMSFSILIGCHRVFHYKDLIQYTGFTSGNACGVRIFGSSSSPIDETITLIDSIIWAICVPRIFAKRLFDTKIRKILLLSCKHINKSEH